MFGPRKIALKQNEEKNPETGHSKFTKTDESCSCSFSMDPE